MPPKRYRVIFHPAEQDGGFVSVHITSTVRPSIDFEAANLDDVLTTVERLGKQQNGACSAWVRCLEKRKPNGFDARVGDAPLYFNLDQPLMHAEAEAANAEGGEG